MILAKGLTLPIALAVSLTISRAEAADFTIEVPYEVTNFAPGVDSVELLVFCSVTRGGIYVSENIVAHGMMTIPLGRGPVTAADVITLEMNAESPRLRPASSARFYLCTADARFYFSDGLVPISGGDDHIFRETYETVTDHTMITTVTAVSGVIGPP